MQEFDKKEKYLVANTLSCIPILLQGYSVLIDMRNETSVAGRIDNADGYMNINLVDAVFIDRNGLQYPFEQFMVRERMIRQIHLPSEFNVEHEIREMVEHGLRKRKQPPKKNTKRTYKLKRAEIRHKETLQEIQKQKALKQLEAEKKLENASKDGIEKRTSCIQHSLN